MKQPDQLTPISPIIIDGGRIDELASAIACLPEASDAQTIEGMIRATLPMIRWSERYVPRKVLATQPLRDPIVRHCARVVSMVHELHKVGYQKIRIIPQEAPNGSQWRCQVTSAENVLSDGITLRDFDMGQRGVVAHYSTGQGTSYFGWQDASELSARALAALFLERFPDIRVKGQGRDWIYAGWLTDFLGRMESAGELGLFTFTADFPLDSQTIDPWMPPPPR